MTKKMQIYAYHQLIECHPRWSVAVNRIASDVLETFQSTSPALLFRKVSNEIQTECYLIAGKENVCFDFDYLVVWKWEELPIPWQWLPWQQRLRIRASKSVQRIKLTRWWLKPRLKSQWKGLCVHEHNQLENKEETHSKFTTLNPNFSTYRCSGVVNVWLVNVPSTERLVLVVGDKYLATSHTKWLHRSMNIQLCMEKGMVKHLERVFQWCLFGGIRKCDVDLSNHEPIGDEPL